MNGSPRIPAEKTIDTSRLYDAVSRYGDRLAADIDRETGELHDPFETGYAEGYGPALAAHIFAGLHRAFGEKRHLDLARLSMRRVFEKLRHPGDNTPFTDIFLYYWALKAYELLGERCSEEELEEWASSFRSCDYHFPPPNTNGYCLLIGTSIAYAAQGFEPVDPAGLGDMIETVRRMQNRLGFIEDAMRKHTGPVEHQSSGIGRSLDKLRYRFGLERESERDLKPIAYHLFCCAVLAESLQGKKRRDMPDLDRHLEGIEGIVRKGVSWMDSFTGTDGSLSMTERSRDQFWTGMCYAYLLALRWPLVTGERIGSHLDWWLRFLKDDGGCSITPNYFSAGLRVGFEHYSISTMYVSLGFSYLLEIADILSGRRSVPEPLDIPFAAEKTCIDEDSGYAHILRGKSSAGISLRRHHGGFFGGYCPAMGLFNLVLGGGRSRPLPAPCYRVGGLGIALATRKSLLPNNGVYEGFRATGGGDSQGPDSTENASVRESGDRLILDQRNGSIETTKSIRLLDESLEIAYTFDIKRRVDNLLVTYPMLLSDGRTETELEIRGSAVTFAFGDERYRLSCAEGYNWHHDQERHLLSSSGITSQLYVVVGESIRSGGELHCTLLLERL
jgi:hypothetical protein